MVADAYVSTGRWVALSRNVIVRRKMTVIDYCLFEVEGLLGAVVLA